MKYKLFYTICAFLALVAYGKPLDLTVGEYFSNPLGYSLENLSVSWKLPEGADSRQTAYRVQITRDSSDFSNPIWDSGKVVSDSSIKNEVPVKVQSRTKYFWRAKYWDGKGIESDWSNVANFETGLLSNADWGNASWISSPVEPPMKELKVRFYSRDWKYDWRRTPPAYFRKEFNLPANIKSARVYVASRGVFQLEINGKRTSDEIWGTGWTDYDKRVQTSTYDVTSLLNKGSNALLFTLADGWRCGTQAWYYAKLGGKKAPPNYKPDIIARLEIELEDGSKLNFATDETWKFSEGSLVEADIYDGELYDARLASSSWSLPKFDASSWKNPKTEKLGELPLLEPRRDEPIRQIDVLAVKSSKKITDGKWIFDFGQNMAGSVKINIPSMSEGNEVILRYAEMLNADGSLYTENYRSAKSTDKYISDGKARAWTPMFTYHGFRYVEVSGLPKNFVPSKNFLQALVWHSDAKISGDFICSAPKINMLQSNIQWGQRSNYFSTPTDCPQRDERMGFLGDTQVFLPTALFNMSLNGFFSKWNVDIADAQHANGNYPNVAPNPAGHAGIVSGWSDCGVICPWLCHLEYSDIKMLRRHYPNMKKWVEARKKASKDFIMPSNGIGDWLQPNPKDKTKTLGETIRPDAANDVISTAYFAYNADILRNVAIALGEKEDEKYFAKLFEDVSNAFVKHFIKEDGEIKSDCQTVYLLPLAWNLISDKELEKKVFAKLIKCLERDNMHLNTGFLGTPLLNPVLTKFGRTDLAYKLLYNEDYPSWIFPINQGATTMWERWNSFSKKDGFGNASMNSFNHYANGAIGAWMYDTIGGIRRDDSATAWKRSIFNPILDGKMTSAMVRHNTPYGEISSDWKVKSGTMYWKIKIPPNTTATVILPAKNPKDVKFDGKAVSSLKLENVPSGEHDIVIKL